MKAAGALLVIALAAPALGCARTPSPLAPHLRESIGLPSRGVLMGGIELPREGKGYRWHRAAFGHHQGIARFVHAIEHAAAYVADERPGGAPLLVGDLSAKRGGLIPGHMSHRTGRDVDLLFYATTPEGAPIPSPGFYVYGADGLAFVTGAAGQGGPRFVRFDTERNWLLVKALLTSPDANVQWIFCAQRVEAMLIEYAVARGEDASLVWKAAAVLQQPGDSLPHDDHFHVRTACTPDEMATGCEGGGPYWPWLPKREALASSDGRADAIGD